MLELFEETLKKVKMNKFQKFFYNYSIKNIKLFKRQLEELNDNFNELNFRKIK